MEIGMYYNTLYVHIWRIGMQETHRNINSSPINNLNNNLHPFLDNTPTHACCGQRHICTKFKKFS